MKCNKSGAKFEGKFCPNCGNLAVNDSTVVPNQPNSKLDSNRTVPSKQKEMKKPIKKQWRTFILVAVIVVAVVASMVGCNKSEGEKINWNDIVMGDVIPQPKSDTAKIYTNSDESLSIYIYKISSSDYSEYINMCEEKGFTVDADKDTETFEAYNADGYKLRIILLGSDDTYMSIDLDAPIKMATIQWPSSTVGKLLPVPKSLDGKFSYEHSDSFFVYIGNTSADDYAEYVTACSNSGFNVDYDKGDDYYYAYNSDGYHLSLNYKGNNTMSISIDSPDESEDDTASTESPELTDEPDITPETTPGTTENVDANGIGIEFKDAMDSYEAFMDEYVAFMKKYAASDGTELSVLTDYANYMSKYSDVVEKFDKWVDEDLNAAETAYYIEVQTRVNKKLLEAAEYVGQVDPNS